ncbi:MAG TPA: hypothetical protein VG826_07100 [Pirellulales bacterium]|nr:hypothetical protein [Pirellulales bacterium]
MPAADDVMVMYLELARAARLRNRPWESDKLLLLAGAAAEERGRHAIASLCRRAILGHNHGHLIGHYARFAEAIDDERFTAYLAQLRRRYTPEKCELMLASLGINPRQRRDRFADLDDYAAAAIGEGTAPSGDAA